MSQTTIIFFMSLALILLAAVIAYQQFAFRRGIQRNLKTIGEELQKIVDTDSEEKIMVFTDNRMLMNLCAQINRLLEERQKIMADFRRSQISSKKMLSNISHDIKTPMTVILGYLEIMRLNSPNPDPMLAKVEQKAQTVVDLINQFFTLAKLESGDMDLKISRIDLCETCREHVLDFYELLTKNNMEVEIGIPEKPVFVMADADALRRILFNLLSNAVRYGSEGKYLGVFLREEGSFVFVDVVDKGRGIDRELSQSVFDRLFTMEDSRNRDIQGNGLGLAIAKNLAQALGGDITLESEPYVRTVFRVKLKKLSY